MFRRKVSILLADVLEVAGGRVDDLHIACHVPLAINFGELVEGLVSNVGHVKLVVSNGEQIVIQILKDGVREETVGRGSITETCTVVKILEKFISMWS